MRKKMLLTLAFFTTFILGFTFRSITTKISNDASTKKVTGIGGIFFKCQDPKKLKEWYKAHLGFSINPYGAVFEWRQGADSTKKGFTQWGIFSEKTKYFAPSTKDFMINYRVENLISLVDELKKDGVTIADSIASVDNGKFVHIMDIEGNKVELWEPNDIENEKLSEKMGSKTIK